MNAPSFGGMLATRQGSLVLALLCAVCAAGVLVFALGRYKTNVQQPVPQATALVATAEIAKGTSGAEIASKKLYKAMPVTATQLSVGAVGNAAQIASEFATSNILPGQQLTTADFGTISGVDTVLKPNQRGVEISTSGAPGASDITQAGSHVDIYVVGGATGNVTSSSGTDSASVAGQKPIASNVLVLKPATPLPVTLGGKSVSGGTLVLALNENLVSNVIDHSGSLYLALRPSKTGPSAITPTTDNGAN